MGIKLQKTFRERIACFGAVMTTPELQQALESQMPIMLDLDRLRNASKPVIAATQKKAA